MVTMTTPVPKSRLFTPAELLKDAEILPSRDQQHYLMTVMRMNDGDPIGLFNGRDGEWLARVNPTSRKQCTLTVQQRLRGQSTSPDLWLMFAPVKKARLDFIAQKATEMGCSRIWPVRTDYCQMSRVNDDRMLANAIEAAEQTERLDIPEILTFTPLVEVLAGCENDRVLIFCDEESAGDSTVNAVTALAAYGPVSKAAILIGPEGGFSDAERKLLETRENCLKVSLGPRILRADTAAIAALACFQSVCGDWVP